MMLFYQLKCTIEHLKNFEIIRSAGFNRIIHFKELGVNKSLINKNKKFFGPLQGIPLHILIEV